nr:hypothetical protein [Desulfuromonadales bacterium]NIR34079.1 hypothetical protein [Desulfuromonadales bacterium]NIS40178.1 hypothetical protein [Desulfuromonadales bacterium]
MLRAFNAIVTVIAILLVVSPVLAGHDFEGQCETCHLSDPSSANLIFVDTID